MLVTVPEDADWNANLVSGFMYFFLVPPKIYDISSDITVNEGSNVSLICTASGKPEPVISWRHITPLGEFTSHVPMLMTGRMRKEMKRMTRKRKRGSMDRIDRSQNVGWSGRSVWSLCCRYTGQVIELQKRNVNGKWR